jgi:hypothetical protein
MFFIFDCNGSIVGNPKGYATHKGAQQQANCEKTKTWGQLWNSYNLNGRLGGLFCKIYFVD